MIELPASAARTLLGNGIGRGGRYVLARPATGYVELESVQEPALVPLAVATALGLREQPGRPLSETLADFLTSRYLLLMLDNGEHLLAACTLCLLRYRAMYVLVVRRNMRLLMQRIERYVH
jgi:hypothetical protein